MTKANKCGGHISQKHLRARISYLYQAATYMQNIVDGKTSLLFQSASEDIPSKANHRGLLQPSTLRSEEISHSTPPVQISGELKNQQKDKTVTPKGLGQTRQFINHLRGVSLKGQIRLASTVKHSLCKRCDSLLVLGSTSTNDIENKSRGGEKPWADVLVVTCNACGSKKRFPIGVKRQPQRTVRGKPSEEVLEPSSATSSREVKTAKSR